MLSICMGYYNRKTQLLKTLNSFDPTDVEICIVDDASSEDQRLEDILESFIFRGYKIKYHRFYPEEKTWVNPCIAFNKAFQMAEGDIIIIQNPENFHVGNILQYVRNNLKKYQYIAFPCLSWDTREFNNEEAKLIDFPARGQCALGWYNHPKYNNRLYHFCTAIHRENLQKLNGFDERFKDGPGMDDDDLVRRVQKLGLSIVSPTDPFVVHQWHESGHIYQSDSHQRFLNNQQIYNDIISGKLDSWS